VFAVNGVTLSIRSSPRGADMQFYASFDFLHNHRLCICFCCCELRDAPSSTQSFPAWEPASRAHGRKAGNLVRIAAHWAH
jgi:hypothetical protein